jgi:glycosyltransferase involved in cell wall biosynthesis
LYGADPGRVTVAHLGVDPALKPVRDPDTLASICRKYGISPPYVLYLGTLQPRKNLVRLIEAFREIGKSTNGPSAVQLVLAGKKGWLCDDILARAKALGIGEQVVLTGYVEEVDLAALYSGAELFVMPSLYEGFCLPVLEAMACGTPVVCSNVSSLPKVAGEAALLFDPRNVRAMAEAIERVLANTDLRRSLVARGYARARSFTWARCAEQVLAVLEGLGRPRA